MTKIMVLEKSILVYLKCSLKGNRQRWGATGSDRGTR